MAITKYAKIQDENASCTGNQARCLKAPDGWTGQQGDYFNLTEALTKGWTEDPNCAGFNAANADCSSSGGGDGTSGTIDRIGINYNPAGALQVLLQSSTVLEVRYTNSSGVSSDWQSSANYNSTVGTTNYNQRVVINSVPPGTITINVRVKNNTSVWKDVTGVVLPNSLRTANLFPSPTGGGDTGTGTGSGTINRAAIQYSPGGATFIMVSKDGTKVPQARIVSNGFDSNWQSMGAWDSTIESETYQQRVQIMNVPQGTHTVQFRFEGDTSPVIQENVTVGAENISRKIYPPSSTIDRVGINYSPGTALFVLIQASQKPQVRVSNSSYDTGWKDGEVFDSTVNTSTYNYRAFMSAVPQGVYKIEVRTASDGAIRRTVSDVGLGASGQTVNLFPSSGSSGSCTITITDAIYDYGQNRLTAVAAGTNNPGTLQYSVNQTAWFNDVTQIAGLVNGSYTLYVRDSQNTDCKAQRGFSVVCVNPPQNVVLVINESGGNLTTLVTNFGTSSQTFRYVVREFPSGGGNTVKFALEAAGGAQTFNLNFAKVNGSTYKLSVQVLNNLTCETIVDLVPGQQSS